MKDKLMVSFFSSLALVCSGVVSATASVAETGSSAYMSDGKRTGGPRGVVYGFVWNDIDGDGELGAGEHGLDDVVVYVDANNNAIRDEDEIATKTNRVGLYYFSRLPYGDYSIRQEMPFGWRNVSGGEGVDVAPASSGVDEDLITAKVIGGAETEPGEYPFMVSTMVDFGGTTYRWCGGSLIADRWIVTAAHCSDFDTSEVAVLVGTHNASDGSGVMIGVKDIHLHPEWNNNASEGHDIAIWELETPVMLAEGGPETIAMLSPEDQELAAGQTLATSLGWGETENEITPSILRDVHVPIFDTQECAGFYPFVSNWEGQICAGAPEGGIDTCSGDSGGPVVVRDFYSEQWKLAGVTSWGGGCALPGLPGVSVRVSAMYDWAKETATEDSRVHRLTIERRSRIHLASFGNQTTLFQTSRKIEPRWQLVTVDRTTDVDAGEISFEWRIIDEAPWQREFNCEVDVDGIGVSATRNMPCFAGSNEAVLAAPEEDGVYLPSFKVRLNDEEFVRFGKSDGYVLGSPAAVSIEGELSADDAVIPGYQNTYYIDYVDLKEVVDERAILIKIEPDDFDAYVYIYDADQHDSTTGGGVIETLYSDTIGGPVDYFFNPEPNANYRIGISTFDPEAQGSYKLTVVNQGTPVTTTIEFSSEERLMPTSFKDPINRLVFPFPIAK
ncbi:MAG: trypsin-like serine protease [Acidiferrobacterales bacterium]|nr:trypsin-like serine protease [Acidiferrobacterales bacterium]